jgi:hypothetical protein
MGGIYLSCGSTIDSWGGLLALNSVMSGRCLLCWMPKCGGLFFLLDLSCLSQWTLEPGKILVLNTITVLLTSTAINGAKFLLGRLFG